MKKPTTISKESVSEYREFVQLRLRKRVLEAIEVVLEEEVDQALGCRSYERAEDRRGYRNGAETRALRMVSASSSLFSFFCYRGLETRARTNDEIMPAWSRQTGD